MKCGAIDISIMKEAALMFYNVMDETFGFQSCAITTQPSYANSPVHKVAHFLSSFQPNFASYIHGQSWKFWYFSQLYMK